MLHLQSSAPLSATAATHRAPPPLQATTIAPEVSTALVEEATFAIEDLLTPAAFPDSLAHTRVFFDMPTSIDNAIGESIGGDAPFIAVAVFVICIFVVLALFVRDRVFTRTSLAFCGIASVCLSISSTFGFSVLIGIPFTGLSTILPFILLGIGVDDLFVLVRPHPAMDSSSSCTHQFFFFFACLC